MEVVGYVGLTSLALCWIPQSIDTLRRQACHVNLSFLLLSTVGSVALGLYALWRGDLVFTILNTITAVGAVINLYYKIRPAA